MADSGSNGVERSIGRLEGKMDLCLREVADLSAAFKLLEAGRLSRLEKQVAENSVRLGMIAAGISVGVTIISSFAQHLLATGTLGI